MESDLRRGSDNNKSIHMDHVLCYVSCTVPNSEHEQMSSKKNHAIVTSFYR